jgi:hypothetical protein
MFSGSEVSQIETSILISPPRRTSVFREMLDENDGALNDSTTQRHARAKSPRPELKVRFRTKDSIINGSAQTDDEWEDVDENEEDTDVSGVSSKTVIVTPVRSRISRKMYRLGVLVLLLAMSLPLIRWRTPLGAEAGPIRGELVDKRDNSPTDICKRWSHQSE